MTRVLQRILRRRDPDPDDEPQLASTDGEQSGPDTAGAPRGRRPSGRGAGRPRPELPLPRRDASAPALPAPGPRARVPRPGRPRLRPPRFERDRPDLVDAKVHALFAVDAELRALERVLGTAARSRSCARPASPPARAAARCTAATRASAPPGPRAPRAPAGLRGRRRRPRPARAAPPAAAARRRRAPHAPAAASRPGPDEPAPFGDETTDGDETREDATQVLPPKDDADDDGSDRRRAFDG